jgi:phage tail-like protein
MAGFGAVGSALANPSQIAENLPSSVVGLVSSLGRAQDGVLKPKYGLVFRFKVTLDDCPLGFWASCQGLRVDFKPVEVKSGGEYDSAHWLPGETQYPRIVLKRAIDPDSSQTVQDWLHQAAKKWITGEAANENPGGGIITLFNSDNHAVMSWQLHGVRPWAWAGPDLDANTSKVAIETLELVHDRFEVIGYPGSGSGPSVSRPMQRNNAGPAAAQPNSPQKFSLTGVADKQTVEFTYKPVKIGISRTTETVALSTTEGQPAHVGERPDVTVLSLSNLVISGPQTATDVKLLLNWSTRQNATGPVIGGHRAQSGGGDGKAGKGKNDKSPKQLPRLKLTWGRGLDLNAKIKSLNASYTRFDPMGNPVRAEVQLSLIVVEASVWGTNPTSGGIPGRSAHTVTADENLQLIAQNQYGSPNRWRDIAEANGIDDPLRLGPGTRLYLPAEPELAARR